MPSSEPGPRSPAPLGAGNVRLIVDVVFEDEHWPDAGQTEASIREVADVLSAHGALEHLETSEACVALSNDTHVQALNAGYRGKNEPTNVLSFPASESAVPQPIRFLGDIVLARETVAREADERGIPFADHLRHLTVHGLLHLIGYDHETEEDAAAMESLETEVLAGMGIADPYGDRDA